MTTTSTLIVLIVAALMLSVATLIWHDAVTVEAPVPEVATAQTAAAVSAGIATGHVAQQVARAVDQGAR